MCQAVGVFEWHGWAVIRGSAGVEDDEEADRIEAERLARVRELVADASGVPNEIIDLRPANGAMHLWLAGNRNHHNPHVRTFYKLVAVTAPGSYGILYTFDNEDNHEGNAWTRWVMRRGAVHPEIDTALSPHIGLVEDPWPT
jgi:hypothetical protein